MRKMILFLLCITNVFANGFTLSEAGFAPLSFDSSFSGTFGDFSIGSLVGTSDLFVPFGGAELKVDQKDIVNISNETATLDIAFEHMFEVWLEPQISPLGRTSGLFQTSSGTYVFDGKLNGLDLGSNHMDLAAGPDLSAICCVDNLDRSLPIHGDMLLNENMSITLPPGGAVIDAASTLVIQGVPEPSTAFLLGAATALTVWLWARVSKRLGV